MGSINPFIHVLLLCSICTLVPAATVHQWVDEDGVTHFSDAPPTGVAEDVKTLELSDDFPAAADARANYYSIANQWERMRQERDAKTQVSLQKERLRAEKAAALGQLQAEPETTESRYYPTYLPYGVNPLPRHRRPGYNDPVVPRRPHHVRSGDGHIGGAARNRPPAPRRAARRPRMSVGPAPE